MRCKVGDIAVVVCPQVAENVGKLVEVLRPGVERDWVVLPLSPIRVAITGGVFHPYYGGIPLETHDFRLRPLRDNDGPDETLAWKDVPLPTILAPKPQKEFVR